MNIGLEIKNGTTGIYIVYNNSGRQSGEAFVQFKNIEDASKALERNREKIGHRSVEKRCQQRNVVDKLKVGYFITHFYLNNIYGHITQTFETLPRFFTSVEID